ncbi:MAG: hypothetical protein ACLGIM_03665, partial [Alphaproteobacteria bacterium]
MGQKISKWIVFSIRINALTNPADAWWEEVVAWLPLNCSERYKANRTPIHWLWHPSASSRPSPVRSTYNRYAVKFLSRKDAAKFR